MEYIVNVGYSYVVEADDEDEALDKAYELTKEEWGIEFARNSWSHAEVK